MGNGLFRDEGKTWKNHRKILSSIFHFEFIRDQFPTIVSTVREFLDILVKSSLKEVKIMDEFQKITGEVVGRIFFGQNLNKYQMDGKMLTLYLAELLIEMATTTRHLLPILLGFFKIPLTLLPSRKKVADKIDRLREVCRKIIMERKESKETFNDMFALLLKTQENPNPEERYSDEDIVNEFITFFLGGMDTTGHLIAMALYSLDKNLQYIKDLENEIKEVMMGQVKLLMKS